MQAFVVDGATLEMASNGDHTILRVVPSHRQLMDCLRLFQIRSVRTCKSAPVCRRELRMLCWHANKSIHVKWHSSHADGSVALFLNSGIDSELPTRQKKKCEHTQDVEPVFGAPVDVLAGVESKNAASMEHADEDEDEDDNCERPVSSPVCHLEQGFE